MWSYLSIKFSLNFKNNIKFILFLLPLFIITLRLFIFSKKSLYNNKQKTIHPFFIGIVRYLRNNINTKFEYNSSKILNGCSKKRPDVFFDLQKHCVIVEIDEN